ncbi:hypothetical protein Tco_1485041 [Tanacetum coccineum]
MGEENDDDDDDDAEVINPYEEADPLNLPPPDSDTESEDMEFAPTPYDYEQEAEADTAGTITRVPYSVGYLLCRNEGDDAATTSDPQPSQPPGSPHYHL